MPKCFSTWQRTRGYMLSNSSSGLRDGICLTGPPRMLFYNPTTSFTYIWNDGNPTVLLYSTVASYFRTRHVHLIRRGKARFDVLDWRQWHSHAHVEAQRCRPCIRPDCHVVALPRGNVILLLGGRRPGVLWGHAILPVILASVLSPWYMEVAQTHIRVWIFENNTHYIKVLVDYLTWFPRSVITILANKLRRFKISRFLYFT